MTTLTIEIPGSGRRAIADTVRKMGGNILYIDAEDDLKEAEFALLQESYKEALMIKQGLAKGIPASQLWND